MLEEETIAQKRKSEAISIARQCVDNMLAHFREFGGVWEKSSGNVVDELEHFNAWGKHQNGEGWQEVTLNDLRAAFRERIQEMEAGEKIATTTSYREELFFGKLLDRAIVEEQSLEQVSRLEDRIANRTENRNVQ